MKFDLSREHNGIFSTLNKLLSKTEENADISDIILLQMCIYLHIVKEYEPNVFTSYLNIRDKLSIYSTKYFYIREEKEKEFIEISSNNDTINIDMLYVSKIIEVAFKMYSIDVEGNVNVNRLEKREGQENNRQKEVEKNFKNAQIIDCIISPIPNNYSRVNVMSDNINNEYIDLSLQDSSIHVLYAKKYARYIFSRNFRRLLNRIKDISLYKDKSVEKFAETMKAIINNNYRFAADIENLVKATNIELNNYFPRTLYNKDQYVLTNEEEQNHYSEMEKAIMEMKSLFPFRNSEVAYEYIKKALKFLPSYSAFVSIVKKMTGISVSVEELLEHYITFLFRLLIDEYGICTTCDIWNCTFKLDFNENYLFSKLLDETENLIYIGNNFERDLLKFDSLMDLMDSMLADSLLSAGKYPGKDIRDVAIKFSVLLRVRLQYWDYIPINQLNQELLFDEEKLSKLASFIYESSYEKENSKFKREFEKRCKGVEEYIDIVSNSTLYGKRTIEKVEKSYNVMIDSSQDNISNNEKQILIGIEDFLKLLQKSATYDNIAYHLSLKDTIGDINRVVRPNIMQLNNVSNMFFKRVENIVDNLLVELLGNNISNRGVKFLDLVRFVGLYL